MTRPVSPQMIMLSSVTSSAPAMLGFWLSPLQRVEAYHPIMEPSMKTSPWAKLISFSTP